MLKNKLRIIFIFIFIIVTSGCSVQYNISINEDLSVNENVIATEKTNRLESRTKLKGSQAVNYLFNMFSKDKDKYLFNYDDDGSDTTANASATYNSIEDYAKDFSNDIFDDIIITRDEDYVTINANQKVALGGNSPTTPIYDSIDVTIEVPFKVVDNNAKTVNGNKYTWEIRKNENLSDIKLTYIEEDIKDEINISVNDKKYSFEYSYIVIAAIGIIILIAVMIILIKSKKNNVL